MPMPRSDLSEVPRSVLYLGILTRFAGLKTPDTQIRTLEDCRGGYDAVNSTKANRQATGVPSPLATTVGRLAHACLGKAARDSCELKKLFWNFARLAKGLSSCCPSLKEERQ